MPDDEAGVRRWFETLAAHVQAVDFAGARPIFSADMVAFGTFTDFMTGRDAAERAQWRNVWPHIDGFRWRPDIRVIVSPDRLQAVGMGVFEFHRIPSGRVRRTTAPGAQRWCSCGTGLTLRGLRSTPTCRCSATCRPSRSRARQSGGRAGPASCSLWWTFRSKPRLPGFSNSQGRLSSESPNRRKLQPGHPIRP